MGIAARHRERQREAILDFPPGPPPKAGASQLQPAQIPNALVARAIASAVAAGWEPLPRGKTVTKACGIGARRGLAARPVGWEAEKVPEFPRLGCSAPERDEHA